MAPESSEIAIFGYPSFVLNPPTEGFPWDDLRKISVDVNGWPRYQTAKKSNIAENFNRLSRVHERYRRTDGRATA